MNCTRLGYSARVVSQTKWLWVCSLYGVFSLATRSPKRLTMIIASPGGIHRSSTTLEFASACSSTCWTKKPLRMLPRRAPSCVAMSMKSPVLVGTAQPPKIGPRR